jgi:SM-20-related protein
MGRTTAMDELVRTEPLSRSEPFSLNPKLDVDKLAEAFRAAGRVRVREVLHSTCADELYQHLHRVARWQTFVVANEKRLGTPVQDVPLTPEEDAEIRGLAYESARTRFASLYDATGLFSEDIEGSSEAVARGEHSVLDSFRQFLASEAFMDFARRVTGHSDLARVEIQGTRFRPGHFVTFHSATRSADKSRKRRACFFFNLTPEWKPERGGMVEFRTREAADVIEAYMPVFNALDIVSFPHGYWVSPVALFSPDPVISIAGRLYSS